MKKGLLMCAKYAVSPNFFGYCGPLFNKSLVDHLVENQADKELEKILSDFETMFPYLNLIARKNKISDPFDLRVVEAYWLGNQLLKPLNSLEYKAFAQEKLSLDKKINLYDFGLINFKVKIFGFFPHHNFHVFNIFRRTGKNFNFHTILTMDSCRIAWGKVVAVKDSLSLTKEITVEYQPLIRESQSLKLSKKKIKKIKVDYYGKKIVKDIEIGDWVSFHWGFLCDRLNEKEVRNLKYFTEKAIEFYNHPL